MWDVKETTATLVWEIKEHRKAVTCFSLFEPGNCLLSGSTDKTIRVNLVHFNNDKLLPLIGWISEILVYCLQIWQMVQRKLECIEVIATKDAIHSIDTSGELIFAYTQSHKIKVVMIIKMLLT